MIRSRQVYLERNLNRRCNLHIRLASASANASEAHDTDLMHVKPPCVMVIAGSDSGGGAGIQADLKTIMTNGCFGTTAVTALTSQDTKGVWGVLPTPPEFLAQQIDVILGDFGATATKIGMLPNAEAVAIVASKIQGLKHVVVDPVMVATSGHLLAGDDVGLALLRLLFPQAECVTPNIPEAEILLGLTAGSITCVMDMEAAAISLLKTAKGCRAVLVKGGHFAALGSQVTDVLVQSHPHDESKFTTTLLSLPVVQRSNCMHGTGCTLSSAIAAWLAKGHDLPMATWAAKKYVHSALAHSVGLRIGLGDSLPFDHGLPPQLSFGLQKRMIFPLKDARDALRLYAVTDHGCNVKSGRTLVQAVELAIQGGCTAIQIREKSLEGRLRMEQGRAVYQLCREQGIPLIINDRVDIALALGPDVGCHLGQDDMPAAEARRLLGPHRLLGISVKTVEDCLKAIDAGADYLGVGACYGTQTKDSSVIGIAGLEAVCLVARGRNVPVVAIGGIGEGNARYAIKGGADGVAVVSGLFGAEDIVAAALALRKVVDAELMTERAKT